MLEDTNSLDGAHIEMLAVRLMLNNALFPISGIGMILAACAMVYSGVLEIYRKKDIENNGYIQQELADETFNASKLSMFVQIPEFAFVGSSEVFASISGIYEFNSLITIGLFCRILLDRSISNLEFMVSPTQNNWRDMLLFLHSFILLFIPHAFWYALKLNEPSIIEPWNYI